MRSDLELNGYLQDNSADSGIDATSFTATQSSTASSTGAFRSKDRAPWQDDGGETHRSSDTPPLTPDSLAVTAADSKEAKTLSAFPLDGTSFGSSDAASRSRCGAGSMIFAHINVSSNDKSITVVQRFSVRSSGAGGSRNCAL